jgi:Kdo2-lipid A phosphotransferase
MLNALQYIDTQTFLFLNGSLVDNPTLQTFWGLLNHKKEASINLLMAFVINLITLLATRDPKLRKVRFFQLLYFWICFEIGFLIQDWFFHSWLALKRLSPSLVVTPVLRLAEVLHNPLIKDFSEHSFPSGHAFAMIYWASFTYLCSPKKVGIPALFLGIFLCIPRLVSGAHWLSDVLFGAFIALLWLWLSVQMPVYKYLKMQKVAK